MKKYVMFLFFFVVAFQNSSIFAVKAVTPIKKKAKLSTNVKELQKQVKKLMEENEKEKQLLKIASDGIDKLKSFLISTRNSDEKAEAYIKRLETENRTLELEIESLKSKIK